MSAVLINDTTMTSIAEAIRSKDNSSEKMLPSEMAGKIKNIPTSSMGDRSPISITYIKRSTTINGKGTICLNSFDSVTVDGIRITPEKVGDNVYTCKYQLEFKTTVKAPSGSVVILY